MNRIFSRPFGYEPIVTKDLLAKARGRKKDRAGDWQTVLRRIWAYVEERRLLAIVLLLVAVSAGLSLLGPYLIGHAIDRYLIPRHLSGLAGMLGLIAGIYALNSLVMYMQSWWMIGISQATVLRLRKSLFGHLQRLPIPFFDKRQHGELMSRVTNDIENISQTLNSSFVQVLSSILTLVGTLAVMLTLSPLLTLLTMLIVPAMFLSMRWITARTGRLYKLQQQALGELNGMIEETVSGQRVVKAFSQEDRVKQEFAEKSAKLRGIGFWAWTYAGFIPKVMNFLNNMSFVIVAAVGGLLAFRGEVTIGTLVIFTEYARQFTRPLNDLANQFNTVLSALAGAERVFAILDEEPEADEAEQNAALALKGDVCFERAVFRYDPEDPKPTLDGVDFRVAPGETVAIVGATGAGKTTVMQLIARFYDLEEGCILFDGVPIERIPRRVLRGQMAFVLQDPFLFEATVRENIRYGRLDATDEEIEEAARRANAHDFIARLDDGYDTVLTADGGEISQGQKQLLSIARALAADPVILLLDEATSSIDTVTELKIQEALDRLMEGRTSFVVAHRLNTVKKADRIFVMDSGKIVESGSPAELLAQRGRYWRMLHADE